MRDEPTITNVYSFTNGMTAVFDQHGQQMPEFQGRTEDVMPKIRAAGYTPDVPSPRGTQLTRVESIARNEHIGSNT
jgi:hypothetical protein